MIDTHTHIYDEAFDEDREAVIRRAVEAGVETLLLPAIDSKSHAAQEQLAAAHPEVFRQMMGLHPTSVDEHYEDELSIVQAKLFAEGSSYVAVGEIGLDLYWDKTFLPQQLDALQRQMEWALQLDLPVALHVRKAHNELFGLLRDMGRPSYRGVMHCFGGSLQEAERAMDLGFYIGVGGVVTFKNASLAQVAANIPLDRLLLETDAPYLAPVPYRGKRNESAYVPVIAAKIAELRGISAEEVADAATANARRLFGL